ncbi:CRTAC1 family protein [Tautonia marina]|uniref:CRTAC1 family protein n=1 Tax=Tautonia marina TaxID=2653855 RepID=UPI001F36628E|nr:CRTAC1 family protein [Tautonia marina]
MRSQPLSRSQASRDLGWPLPHRALISMAVVLVVVLLIATGCHDPLASSASEAPPPPPSHPASGPWFVDRAPEFGLNVVTISGSPEKRSILESLGVGVALFDADGDGDLDIFVASGSQVVEGEVVSAGGPWLFRNDGPGHWTDTTSSSGLQARGWAQGVAVADYDADGDLDLFLAQHGPDVLWQNLGDGTFRDVTEEAGLGHDSFWGVAATWGDYDGDGWPDLYVTNYVTVDAAEPPPQVGYRGRSVQVFAGPESLRGEPDVLWRNRGDGTFEDVTESVGLLSPEGKGMGALFADFDRDGDLDLFVTNDTQPNEFFRNENGHFHEEGQLVGLALSEMGRAEGSMGIDLADLDGDGWFDLAYSNFHKEGTRLLINHEGRMYSDIARQSSDALTTILYVGWGIVLADFNHDGHPDLFQANGHVYPLGPTERYDQPPMLLRNVGALRFEDVTSDWGPSLADQRSGRSVAAGDLDHDGDLDLVMTTIDGPLRVLINEGQRLGHSITLRLVGRPPNRDAVGAIAELQAGGKTWINTVRRGGSFMAASDSSLHFGIGPTDSITSLQIHWPDGTSSLFPGESIPINSSITLSQDDPTPIVLPYHHTGR